MRREKPYKKGYKLISPEMEISGAISFDIGAICELDDGLGEWECISKEYLYSNNGKDYYRYKLLPLGIK